MKIKHVTLVTTKLEEMKHFYTKTLELQTLSCDKNSFTLIIGTSLLTFVSSAYKPFYHLAFRTDSRKFDTYYSLLAEENCLLPNEEGETSLYWKGRQLYFTDPEGNVMEILERKFPMDTKKEGLYDICEVGLPSPDVEEMRSYLSSIPNSIPINNNLFQFYGDNNGVFVLVKEGRHWYPTKKGAQMDKVLIELEADKHMEFIHPALPYKIIQRQP